MTEVKILNQTMMPCQQNQHESEAKKGKILHGDLCQNCVF